ncbi:MAG TPA: alternative ribosome rescue aminoacyl-tRNA hydrolase ArfB [Thermoanaerobaculia bacterium]|nr:alternative ribosome rescue aminoacyl-tRNA hydrolase ArfB [Thermoanaerobaculia bacterium]
MSDSSDLGPLERFIQEEFVRSSGPGGQNVNKVATAVQLRFDLERAELPLALKERLRALAGRRMGADGLLRIEARRFRTQEKNRRDARRRLTALLERAATPPRPRRPTTVPKAVKRRRRESKRRQGRVKALRRPVSDNHD